MILTHQYMGSNNVCSYIYTIPAYVSHTELWLTSVIPGVHQYLLSALLFSQQHRKQQVLM